MRSLHKPAPPHQTHPTRRARSHPRTALARAQKVRALAPGVAFLAAAAAAAAGAPTARRGDRRRVGRRGHRRCRRGACGRRAGPGGRDFGRAVLMAGCCVLPQAATQDDIDSESQSYLGIARRGFNPSRGPGMPGPTIPWAGGAEPDRRPAGRARGTGPDRRPGLGPSRRRPSAD